MQNGHQTVGLGVTQRCDDFMGITCDVGDVTV